MMPAAKHFDPVLGVDIHMIQPPGPVPPVPIPHPFVGFLIDPMDYVPIVGATVKVNGSLSRTVRHRWQMCAATHSDRGSLCQAAEQRVRDVHGQQHGSREWRTVQLLELARA
jgi:hypothetical protein